ncbi:hypothetical protein ACEH97_003592 [Vibrio alginolyticus]
MMSKIGLCYQTGLLALNPERLRLTCVFHQRLSEGTPLSIAQSWLLLVVRFE